MTFTFKHTKFACYCGYIVSAVINNFTPLLFIIFQTDFGITMGQLSFLITLNFGVQMTVDFLGAHFADKIGYKISVVAANIFSAAGLILMGTLPFLMNPFAGLVIAVVTYAVGSGLLEVLVSPIVEALPTDGKAASMSLLHSFYCWGHVAVVLLTTLYFSIFGTKNWTVICVIWAILPIFTALLYSQVPINSFTNEENKIPIRKLFGMKIFWVFLILMLCSGAAEQGMAQWASLFAESALGVSKTVGDLFGPCMFAITMGISRVVYGKAAAKLNFANYILTCAGLCIASYLLVSLSPNSVLSLIGCALCGFSVGVMWPGVLSLAAGRCPQGGTALFALLALAGDVGCFTGPNTAAAISEKFTIGGSALKAGLLGCVIFPVAMILCTLLLKVMKDRKEKNHE